MSKRRSEKLEEAYTKQEKALRKLAEIEQQIFDLEGSYLEGASLKVRVHRARVPPTWAADHSFAAEQGWDTGHVRKESKRDSQPARQKRKFSDEVCPC
jgi:hypothetical protein